MTDLQIRKIPFRFDDTVPFQWNPENPEFGLVANAIGVLVVAMEKMIVSVTRKVMPRIRNPEVKAEADAFLRQEALHSRAHQLHLAALVERWPGLQQTNDEVDESFRRLEREHDLDGCVAYIAALEATFPALFELSLEHRDALLSPGDARVASLFASHFVEESKARADIRRSSAACPRASSRSRSRASCVRSCRAIARPTSRSSRSRLPGSRPTRAAST